MTINKERNESTLTLALAGRLDTVTAPELEAALKDSLEGVSALVLDLKDLEYVSSAGLRVLLAAQKMMREQGNMKLTNVNETVMEVFELTGFSQILTIE